MAAIASLIHDVTGTIGLYSLFQLEFNVSSIAALLTIIGYSVNDSVVLFDRIRELLARDRTVPLPRLTNQAILQTLPRTVSTGTGAALILTALAVLADGTLTDFALALLIGGAFTFVYWGVRLPAKLGYGWFPTMPWS